MTCVCYNKVTKSIEGNNPKELKMNFRYKETESETWRYTNDQVEWVEKIEKRAYGIKMLAEVWNNIEKKWVAY